MQRFVRHPRRFAPRQGLRTVGSDGSTGLAEHGGSRRRRKRRGVVGHFDLLARYNGQGRFFDEDSPHYQGIAIEAVREAAKTGVIFEVNSGALARGIPNRIYPARFLLREIRRLGGQVVLSSDAHRAAHLTFAFPEMEAMLREAESRPVEVAVDETAVQRAVEEAKAALP